MADTELALIEKAVMEVVLSREGRRRYNNGDPLTLDPSDLRDIVRLTMAKCTTPPSPSTAPDVHHVVVEDLKIAAECVLKRWDSPLWRKEVGTAELMNRLRAALASRPAEVDDWISLVDRMPEPGQQVIAYRPTAELTQDSTVRIVRYLGAGRERESWQGVRHGFDCICHPTHWKPIPGAPSHTTNKEK